MQIMTGCERLQAEKCFWILYFPFSHLTCLHTHNCLRHNKTCFLGWLPRLDITGIPLYGRLGNSTLEFAVVAPPSLFTGVDKSTAGLNSQTVLMRIYAHLQNLFHCCSLFSPAHGRMLSQGHDRSAARTFQRYERTCELDDFTRDEFCILKTR